jgi:hypothetical protein
MGFLVIAAEMPTERQTSISIAANVLLAIDPASIVHGGWQLFID